MLLGRPPAANTASPMPRLTPSHPPALGSEATSDETSLSSNLARAGLGGGGMGGVPYYGATWYPLLLLVQSLAFPHWTATFPGHTIIWRVPSISSTLGTVIGTQSGLNLKNKKQRLWNGLMKVDQG